MSNWAIKCKDTVAVIEADTAKKAVDIYLTEISADMSDGYVIFRVTDIITGKHRYTEI